MCPCIAYQVNLVPMKDLGREKASTRSSHVLSRRQASLYLPLISGEAPEESRGISIMEIPKDQPSGREPFSWCQSSALALAKSLGA